MPTDGALQAVQGLCEEKDFVGGDVGAIAKERDDIKKMLEAVKDA